MGESMNGLYRRRPWICGPRSLATDVVEITISDRERGILAGAMAEVTAAEGHDVTVQALSKHRHGGAAFADSAAYAELTGNKD
jgi:hypothetical protein